MLCHIKHSETTTFPPLHNKAPPTPPNISKLSSERTTSTSQIPLHHPTISRQPATILASPHTIVTHSRPAQRRARHTICSHISLAAAALTDLPEPAQTGANPGAVWPAETQPDRRARTRDGNRPAQTEPGLAENRRTAIPLTARPQRRRNSRNAEIPRRHRNGLRTCDLTDFAAQNHGCFDAFALSTLQWVQTKAQTTLDFRKTRYTIVTHNVKYNNAERYFPVSTQQHWI